MTDPTTIPHRAGPRWERVAGAEQDPTATQAAWSVELRPGLDRDDVCRVCGGPVEPDSGIDRCLACYSSRPELGLPTAVDCDVCGAVVGESCLDLPAGGVHAERADRWRERRQAGRWQELEQEGAR